MSSGNFARKVLQKLCGESPAETLRKVLQKPRRKWKISEYAAAEACGNLKERRRKLDEGLSDGPCVSVA